MKMKNMIDILHEGILLFDGAMGSLLISSGISFSVPEEVNLLKPSILEDIAAVYTENGSIIVETNTFGASSHKLRQFNLENKLTDIIISAVEFARKGARDRAFVFGSIGPTGLLPEPLGDHTFKDMLNEFRVIINNFKIAGADGVIIETMSHLKEVQAAMLASREHKMPFFVQITLEENGRTLHGFSPSVFADLALKNGAIGLGFNCSLGPDGFLKPLQEISTISLPIGIQANAGLPIWKSGNFKYTLNPGEYAEKCRPLLDNGLNYIGGCCGTTPEHIRELAKIIKEYKARSIPERSNSVVISSGFSHVKIGTGLPIKIIGERINPTAKKNLTEAILNNDWGFIIREAKIQIDANASIIDINIGIPDIDEAEKMRNILLKLEPNIRAPFSIDTGKPETMKEALYLITGSPLINSISGKSEDLEKKLSLIAEMRSPFIALPLDDKGIPETSTGRIKILEKIIKAMLDKGLSTDFMLADGLVMALISNQENIMETLETIRKAKNDLELNTVLGISNISYGLPARKYLNSAFMAMAAEAGLDAVIANPLSEEMNWIIKSSDVLTGRDAEIKNYISLYSTKIAKPAIIIKKDEEESPEDVINDMIFNGLDISIKSTIKRYIDKRIDPLNILNDYLLPSIRLVGISYEKGEIYLPQLMLSAKAMESALEILKPVLSEKIAKSSKKSNDIKIILATVKGDIHDIGKNLVGTLLRSFGHEVIDLGKDVDAERIVNEAGENEAHIIGLSALMTTTVNEMEKVVEIKNRKNINSLIIVGGAVVTEQFAQKIGADGYGKDALSAVSFVEKKFSS
ncbi:MAG: homocysteine S-methyltransferase family protein [Candidatus Coatesbacteria bacterium]|nr:homocysteine S-methyltransferase family protein [Candidatus Coatesbacteria bacterium]